MEKSKGTRFLIIPAIILTILLSMTLAWISSDFKGIQGWESFLGALALGGAVLTAGLRGLREEVLPQWVLWLTVGAALIRLGAGVLWYSALPHFGYDTEVQRSGYIMEDAFKRDVVAWELAQSEDPLWTSFTNSAKLKYRNADQYGGLLFLSAATYRYIGGENHRPLMMVTIAAAFSALAVAFSWAFIHRVLDRQVAKWTAWGMALYPEAVLLGSTQMREAFMMALAAAAIYGLVRYWQDRSRAALGWLLGSFLLSLSLSPPLTMILLGVLVVVGLALGKWQMVRNWHLWVMMAVAALIVVGGLWLGWERIAPSFSAERFSNPLAMVVYWVELSARWQAKLTAGSSGWVQKILRSTPDWFDLPFLMGYGIARPLLPSALTASSVPIWRVIGVWRALGWTLLLPVLIYAPIRAIRTRGKENQWSLMIGLSVAAWIVILIAAFWGGGDMWDNPRYRVSFSTFQIALAAWMAVAQLRNPDPWMRRALVGVLAILAWFLPWYLRRYTSFEWPVVDLFKLLGLGVATAVLYSLWDWAGQKQLEAES